MQIIDPTIIKVTAPSFDGLTAIDVKAGSERAGTRQFVRTLQAPGGVIPSGEGGIAFPRPSLMIAQWDTTGLLDVPTAQLRVLTQGGAVRHIQVARLTASTLDTLGRSMIVAQDDSIQLFSGLTPNPRVQLAFYELDAQALAGLSCCEDPDEIEVIEGPLQPVATVIELPNSVKKKVVVGVEPTAGDTVNLPPDAFTGQEYTVVNFGMVAADVFATPPGPPVNRINFTTAVVPFPIAANAGAILSSLTFRKLPIGEDWAVV